MSGGHTEGHRSPTCRDRRGACQRLHSQVSSRLRPEDRPLGAARSEAGLRWSWQEHFQEERRGEGGLRGVESG